jgi:hypothetical protein
VKLIEENWRNTSRHRKKSKRKHTHTQKTRQLYPMEFYSAMNKNEILSFAGKWMELENIILNEISQVQKTKNPMFSLICTL